MHLPDGSNIVFVVLDTVRKDHLTPYGYHRETTPALEVFAEEAAVYDHAVTPAPWTLPVHASLFTGLYPSEHGASQETPYLDDVTTLAELLADAGYTTGCYSSNAWITPYTGLTNGFDAHDNFFEILPSDFLAGPLANAWRTLNESPTLRALADRLVALGNRAHEYLADSSHADSKTPAVIDRAIDFTTTHEQYFLFLNLMDAHLPYHPPAEYRDEFAPGVDPDTVCQNSKEYNAGARRISDDEWEAIRGLYDAEIRHIDAELARLFAALRETDQWDDTLVIVCADHGELHGEHELFGHEFCLYDPVINVPLLIKHPALDAVTHSQQVELLDLYHTILDHANLAAPHASTPLDRSRSILAADYRSFEDGQNAYIEYSRPVIELQQLESKAAAAGISLKPDSRFYSRMRAIRRKSGKYIRNERIPDEFYRFDGDGHETDNRIGTGDPLETELREQLDAFETRMGGWSTAEDGDGLDRMSDQARDRLRDLGYLE